MKKNWILIGILALVIGGIVLFGGLRIQSVDEYYLEHLEDIRPDSDTVTLEIRCDTVLANWENLDPALRSPEFVPSDGTVLKKTEYVLREGDTVRDVLSRAVRRNEIQIETLGSKRKTGGTVYIKGMHYLYEYSCGPLSGWMYRVNGEFPGAGCSEYRLKDGDVIEWVYSCDLGHDVGDHWSED